jgi:hypothetical protein
MAVVAESRMVASAREGNQMQRGKSRTRTLRDSSPRLTAADEPGRYVPPHIRRWRPPTAGAGPSKDTRIGVILPCLAEGASAPARRAERALLDLVTRGS